MLEKLSLLTLDLYSLKYFHVLGHLKISARHIHLQHIYTSSQTLQKNPPHLLTPVYSRTCTGSVLIKFFVGYLDKCYILDKHYTHHRHSLPVEEGYPDAVYKLCSIVDMFIEAEY